MLCLQGNSAINVVKKLVGGTEPSTSDVGTIRGDYTLDSYEMSNMDARAVRNLIHCSDNPEDAVREVALWFSDKELVNYKLFQEQVEHATKSQEKATEASRRLNELKAQIQREIENHPKVKEMKNYKRQWERVTGK
jgi:hypothetical protein